MPLVSVVAICYNHEKYVIGCLNSIKNQTYKNVELIIIDSNSTDQSVALIEKWLAENNVNANFIKHTSNHKLTENLNIALRIIQGEYYQGISCDDQLVSNKIELQVAALSKTKENVALVFSGIIKIDEKGEELGKSLYCRPLNSKNYADNLVFGSLFYSPSVLLKTSAVRAIGGYDETLSYEDWDLTLRLSKVYEFIELPAYLAKYRFHEYSMTEAFSLDKCLSVIRIAERENKINPNKAFIKKATAFSRKIVISEHLFSYRLTELIEQFWPSFSLFLVKIKYKTYLTSKSKYLSK